MAARSISTATISFGLVSIPVKLFSATQPQSAVSFNLLHGQCGGKLKQQYICPRENDMKVERDQMVKGYEFAKDRYVTFTVDELKSMEEKATQSIDIAEFIPAAKVDPIYFDKAYYLGPDKGGDRAYRLLSEAMIETGRVALARYAARGKQYLVMLRPVEGGGIALQQLLYKDEVRPFADVDIAKTDVKEHELKLAKSIIEQISQDEFKPEQYDDEVKKRVLEQIQRKVEGQEVQAAPEQPQTQIIDLMEALKASLQGKPKAAAPAPVAAVPAPAPAAKPASAPRLQAVPDAPAEPEVERKPAKRAPREKAAKGKSSAKE
jgi:DNA end-binding protein Ku